LGTEGLPLVLFDYLNLFYFFLVWIAFLTYFFFFFTAAWAVDLDIEVSGNMTQYYSIELYLFF
jgi:hypothetical protein